MHHASRRSALRILGWVATTSIVASIPLRCFASDRIVTWGCADGVCEGQDDPQSTISLASNLSSGAFHSLVVLPDGTLRVWGSGSEGSTNGSFPNFRQSIVPSDLGPVLTAVGGGTHTLDRPEASGN